MRLKNWFVGLCLAVLLVSEFFLFQANRQKEAANVKWQEAKQEADQLRADLNQTNAAFAAEISHLQNQSQEELVRLRGLATGLQATNRVLSQQLNTVLVAAQQQQQQMEQLQTENEQARVAAEVSEAELERNQCISNLREIQAAKQQWASDNDKPANAVPTEQDLLPYFKNGVFPVCPSGGTYTIGAVDEAPTCSVPGHVLPQ